MECKGVGSRPARNRRSSQLLSNLGCARLHIATQGPPASARKRVVSGPYTRGQGRYIVHQRPPTRLREVV